MDNAYSRSAAHILKHFSVKEQEGLSDAQVEAAKEKYGRNGMQRTFGPKEELLTGGIAIAEDPPTPLWELILEQFKDQLVIILLGSAAVSFVLAIFEEGGGWTAFVDPAVVSHPGFMQNTLGSDH
jgi:P-type Ca2+ transporter type 2A